MRITLDLDNVIFNMDPLYQKAFRQAGQEYKKQTSWDIDTIYEEEVCCNLIDLWTSDYLYSMPVLDKKMPHILNVLMARPDTEVLFVTERLLKQPRKSFQQLRRAGIKCTFDQVIDKPGLKSDILKDLQPDVHFDDSPYVIKGCIKRSVPVVMISNGSTLYNHDLRDRVEHYPNLRAALIGKGLIQKTK